MKGWKIVKFGELIEKKTSLSLKKGETYCHIPMENVVERFRTPLKVNSKIFNGSGSKFKNSDTLFARITPCLQNGKIAYAPNMSRGIGFGSTEFFVFRAKPSLTDSKYIYYLSKLKDLKKTAELSMTGASGRQRADINAILEFEVQVPEDINEHKHISSVLSSYDDLIETNQKRIKILEEMVRRLYAEWFVKYKFPGHEGVKMIASGTDFDEIPEEWTVKKLCEFADLIMGQSPKSEFYNQVGTGLAFHQGVKDFNGLFPTNKVYSSKGTRFAEDGDLLFSVRAPVGKMNISTEKIVIGRGLSAIRHKEGLQAFLITSFFHRFTEEDMLGNGAIYKSINKEELRNIRFVYPTSVLALRFNDIAINYFDEISILSMSINKLIVMRDLLVENLTTGKRLLKN